ncbi:hypothetical protein L210DRAFT_3563367 [Boletus edulis BED1]|uniref:Protein kinase domain-containing protein n=1 Tax=Boletus edulis BED1 TaxID=1328754 RepID=A0AAD4G9B5_BOLED|nr:hypothetical protein L210DRAFT_3563367 [Boletus edulis BED1]
MDELTLTCWIRSEDPEAYFRVKISKTDIVLDLQKAIKDKKPVTFSNVDAYTLALYKPKTAVSKPYKEHLSKIILSEHGEPLRKLNELSKIFPEPPPKGDIHVIVDAPSRIVCWLRRADLNDRLPIKIRPGEGLEALIPRVKEAHEQLKNVALNLIRLYKISGDESELQGYLNETGGGERLQENTIARNFLDVPVLDPLRVVIDIVEIQIPTLFQEIIPHVEGLEKYKDIFLKVKDWGTVDESDIESNGIEEAEIDIPPFVIIFEKKLLQKPRLPLDLRIQASDNPEQYFEPYQTLTAGDSQEEIRHANSSEVFHTSGVAQPNWQLSWERNDLKEPIMASMFFDAFLYPAHGRKTAWKDKRWPITVVVQREGEPLRQYSPRSDFLISNSALPRLLVQVNSTPKTQFPKDLRRMLATGAFVVRFANNFVSKFSQRKDFVLCTFFIAANGTATRYNLFQKLDGKVYYTKKAFPLGGPLGRVEFARHLYNLRAELDQKEDQDAKDAVEALVDQVKKCKMKLMYTKSETGRGGGNGHNALLRAHGYELQPKIIMDDSGGTLEPVYKMPDHILTVYKRTNPNKMFIAKKAREESDELEILKILDTMRPKTDHVISLVDSFDEWAIFPRMTTIEYYVDVSRKELQSKVPQVCLGLIEGVAYLHRLCIAHRDIKSDNLVVDKNFTLQIIDFDVAMRVTDEDEEVDDQCGTQRWMAPEVKKKLWHSPIKADRWSCGLVLLFLLGVSGKEDISLKRFARSLMAHDPKERPSLLKWDRYLPPPFSDSDARKTSQLRRDRLEGDGEMTKPNVKKQRLDSGLGGLQ